MVRKIQILAAMLLAIAAGPVPAESEAEQTAKTLCAGCHGPEGISTNPLWPNLAGQKSAYFEKQMRAYRDGERSDPNMNVLSQNLTDAQIAALAEYYAKLPCGESET